MSDDLPVSDFKATLAPGTPRGVDVPRNPARELMWQRPGFLVRRLHQIHLSMFLEECKDYQITPVQYGILSTLSVMPTLDQTTLGAELGLDRTTTADVVRRLEDRGLVQRSPDLNDRRIRLVKLTADGRAIVDKLRSSMERAQDRMLEPLNPAERAMFLHLLNVLVESNNQHGRTVLRAV